MATDYGRLIERSWQVFWRNKMLWILGFISVVTVSLNYGTPTPTSYPNINGPEDLIPFYIEIFRPLLGLIAVSLVLLLVLSILHAFGEASLIAATDSIATSEKPLSFADTWKMGVPYGLRLWLLYAITYLLSLLVVLLIVAPFALLIFSSINNASSSGNSSGGLGVLAFCLGCFALLILTPASIILQLVLQFAPRALVLDNEGIFQSLRTGWRLLRANVGATIITVLISIGVAIAQTIVSIIPGLIVAAPTLLTAVNNPEAFSQGITAQSGALTLLFGLLAGLLVSVVAAPFVTFNSVLWTNLYRHLRQKPNGDLSPVPVGGYYAGQQPPYGGGQYNQQQPPYGGQQQPPYGGQYGGGTPTTQMPPYGQQQSPYGQQPPYGQPPQQQPPYSGGFSVPGAYPEGYQGGQPPVSGGQSPTAPLGGSETYGPGPVQWGGSETTPEQDTPPTEGEKGR